MASAIADEIDAGRPTAGRRRHQFDVVVGCQREVDTGSGPVIGSVAGGLGDRGAGIVDDVGVVAAEPFETIGSAAAVGENIVTRIADDHLGKGVAGEVDGRCARRRGRRHHLDVGTGSKCIADAGGDPVVRALAGHLVDHIAGVIHIIDVIARPPGHGVGPPVPRGACHCRDPPTIVSLPSPAEEDVILLRARTAYHRHSGH